MDFTILLRFHYFPDLEITILKFIFISIAFPGFPHEYYYYYNYFLHVKPYFGG